MSTSINPKGVEILVCPETKLKVSPYALDEVGKAMGGNGSLAPRKDNFTKPFGVTPVVLLREDLKGVYPVVDGIPILMSPEMLTSEEDIPSYDLSDPRYKEAYEEMTHYNKAASMEAKKMKESTSFEILNPVLQASEQERMSFPQPRNVWLDAVYDCVAQEDVYEHIAPVKGKRVLQLGGKGIHAVKFLLAGADEAWVVTPMLGEAR